MHTNNLKVLSLTMLALGLAPLTTWGAGFRSPDVFFLGAAQASDASTEFYNVAGLAMLDRKQFEAAGTGTVGQIHFDGMTTRTVPGAPPPHTPLTFVENGGASSDVNGVLPMGFYAQPIIPGLTAGFGYYEPFGLGNKVAFDTDSIMRFAATTRDLVAHNYSAGLAYRPVPLFSFGGGIDYQQLHLVLNNKINPLYHPGTPPTPIEAEFLNSGDSNAFGWHAGILLLPFETTRIGLSYRSGINHQVHGESSITSLGSPPLPTSTPSDILRVNVPLPGNALFSVLQVLPQQWAVNFNAEWTNWSRFKNITLENVAHFPTSPRSITSPQNYQDTWRFMLAGIKQLNPKVKVQFGAAYDQAVNFPPERSPALPDGYKISVGVGLSYDATKNTTFQIGYVHPFYEVVDINNTTPAPANVQYVGTGTRSADALGLKWIYRFGAEVA